MTSYMKPLHRINQLIQRGNLVVSTNLQRNSGRHGFIVSFKRNESSSKAQLKIKLKRHKAKRSAINVTIHQGNGMLKAFVSKTKNHEFEGFTNLEKAMLTEEESNSKPPRVSVFQQLDEKEENGDNSTEFIDNAQLAPPQIEDGGQATVDELREINLETDDEPKPIFVEIDKLIDVGFIREVQYLTWLANILLIKKKIGQICVCIDFRDLNYACPKNKFLLPITELLVDATTSFEALSFMDGFSGYTQIKMAPEDEELTAFRTPKGIYCYTTPKAKMNHLKCAFGVTSRKFLGFVVSYRGIEVDPSKIKAIMEMPPLRNLRELRGLQGRLAYIRKFISNLSGRCQPFTRLMKKDVPFMWDDACQNTLSSIKEYLLKPPVLMAPIKGKPLILYIVAVERSLGVILAQNNEEGEENALYYLSRTLVGVEQNYTPIEKKAIKGQALADFLAVHPVLDNMELPSDLPDKEVFLTYISQWQLYFDRAARKKGARADIMFITPYGGLIPYSFSLMELCSNDVAEYESLIIGLEIALELHVDCLQAYGDS
ncbi:uncharacterized protein LOC126602551 [Malus sylvestris]|uniref:uncharacterized protein LOC126602551 n=1 Tax=Malus sylvestris TaxID=3752 RepID=UPI0021ACC7AB|nr:uncharacterized protein LOC126602551 [Malus sylvestris]